MKFRIRLIDLYLIACIAALGAWKREHRPPKVEASAFSRQVDISPLYAAAVQADGRVRSFESHAKINMGFVSGPVDIHGQPNTFTYLDLLFRPEVYADEPVIYIKNKLVREDLLGAMKDDKKLSPELRDLARRTGMFVPARLFEPAVLNVLDRLEADLIKTNRDVTAIHSALGVMRPAFLFRELRVLPPAGGEDDESWISLADVTAVATPADAAHAGVKGPVAIPGLDGKQQQDISETWTKLREAWRNEDPPAVNVQIAKLASMFSTSAHYPDHNRLSMESWYFRNKSMTWVWLFYLAGVIPLLLSTIYKWDRARVIGLVMFFAAFLAHTASIAIRWYISGRWPNSNMFEAVTTSVWFGGVAALVLEWIARRTHFRNLFALSSSVASMVALMAAYFMPADLDSGIRNKMAALNDVWLYIHTNMIIASYALIALAAVSALLLLRHRWCIAWDEQATPRWRLAMLPIAFGVLNYTAYLLIMGVVAPIGYSYTSGQRVLVAGGFVGSFMLLAMELWSTRMRRNAGGSQERSAVGGASSIILGGPATKGGFVRAERPTTSQVLDGATMVMMELAFVTLWTGVVMGAIWADHSWGRPWGWDPKEVFALTTFVIFVILVHVRMKVRDKGFWTAVLAAIGFEVMMFNWIAVNFIITGLHSYA